MAFRKKAEHILASKPDILIIPECEHPDKLKFREGIPVPDNCFWWGSNRNKGLGIFSYNGFRLKLLSGHNTKLKTIVPLSVTKGKLSFTLLAIWANNPGDPDGVYVTQVWKAIHYYSKILKRNKTILAGDFNSNTIWDKPRRVGNHSAVVKKLAAKNIHSIYHQFFTKAHGKEEHPTLYMYRHLDKPYHIDYCFASADLAAKVTGVQVGDHDSWSAYSDHTPLTVTFDL